jgi:hypothetical protein
MSYTFTEHSIQNVCQMSLNKEMGSRADRIKQSKYIKFIMRVLFEYSDTQIRLCRDSLSIKRAFCRQERGSEGKESRGGVTTRIVKSTSNNCQHTTRRNHVHIALFTKPTTSDHHYLPAYTMVFRLKGS